MTNIMRMSRITIIMTMVTTTMKIMMIKTIVIMVIKTIVTAMTMIVRRTMITW